MLAVHSCRLVESPVLEKQVFEHREVHARAGLTGETALVRIGSLKDHRSELCFARRHRARYPSVQRVGLRGRRVIRSFFASCRSFLSSARRSARICRATLLSRFMSVSGPCRLSSHHRDVDTVRFKEIPVKGGPTYELT